MIYCWPTTILRAVQIVRTAHYHTHGVIRHGWHGVRHGLTVKGAIVATTVLVCVSVPPPGESQPPPVPTIVTPPGPPWGYPPPPWAAVPPPEDTYVPAVPIPLGSVLEAPGGPQQTESTPPVEVTTLPPLCPPTVVGGAPVPEPWTIAVLGVGLVGLWLLKNPKGQI